MDLCFPAVAARSSSLPTSPGGLRNLVYHSSRRNSEIMVVDDPMTPPLSPAKPDRLDVQEHIIVDNSSPSDLNGPVSMLQTPQSPSHQSCHSTQDSQDAAMDRDESSSCPSTSTPPRPPARLLENEEEHIHRSLSLTDFEVKGTLGPCRTRRTRLFVFLLSDYPLL